MSKHDLKTPSFTFRAALGRSEIDLEFNFNHHPPLPGRICALTGPSSSGKTAVLRQIAEASRSPANAGGPQNKRDIPFPWLLNTLTPSGDDLTPAVMDPDRLLQAALTPLATEPSFINAGTSFLDPGNDDTDPLSTGHQRACRLIARISTELIPSTLVLIDQPEAFLHPSVQAAFMTSLHTSLEDNDACAIIATTSPVMLQDIPSDQVHVLRRHGSITKADRPSIETYGENPGIILRNVLSLDHELQRSVSVIKDMAAGMTMEEIEAIFPLGLSSQARALVMQIRAEKSRAAR